MGEANYYKTDKTLVVMPEGGPVRYDEATKTLYVPPEMAVGARLALTSPDFLPDMMRLAEFLKHRSEDEQQYTNEHNARRREEWGWYFGEGAAPTPIDYDAALEIWEAASNGFGGTAESFDDNEPVMVVRIIEEWEKRRWIPIDERLPADTGEYLVATNDPTTGIVIAQWGDDWFVPGSDGRYLTGGEHVTHWMPLPERPPKAD